jgi:hypothetical protein
MGIDRVERLVLEKNRWTSSGIPFESQKVLDGQSDRGRLMVGYVSDGVVYLTPLDAVLQSRPHLKHVDAIDAQSKQLLANNKRDSTDESGGSEAEDQTAAMAASKRLTLQVKYCVYCFIVIVLKFRRRNKMRLQLLYYQVSDSYCSERLKKKTGCHWITNSGQTRQHSVKYFARTAAGLE